MRPLGFLLSDVKTISDRVKCTVLKNSYEYKYTPDKVKKDTTFLVFGKELISFISGKKLLGRFLVLSDLKTLKKLGADLIDCKVVGSKIERINNWEVSDCDSVRTKFKRLVRKKHFVDRLIKTRTEEQKVFKHTLQFLMSLYDEECKKKNIKPNKVEIVKTLAGVSEFDYSDKKLKKLYMMFDSWKETNGGKRTLQAFHDICLNDTEFNQAVYDNLADPFSLKILVDTWTDKVEFPYFNGDVISNRVVKLRKKKPVKQPTFKRCIA